MPRSPRLIAGLMLVSLPALAAQPITGWNGYKFGQTPDAARAVPGMTFGRFTPKNLMNEDVGAMAAQKDASVNGRAYKLYLYFDASQKLDEISLNNQIDATRPDCEKRFLGLVALMEKTYGTFLAVGAQHPRNAADTPQMALVWKKQGVSSYQISTVFLENETASAWKARDVQSGNYIDIDAAWSARTDDSQAPCVTSIDFKGR